MENEIKKNEHSPELKSFIKEHSYFWWWVPEERKEHLSLNSVVEATLNFGNINEIKQLFKLIGIEKVSEIFFKQISGKRPNYSKRTINFFKLYFNRNVHRDIN